MFFFKSFWQRLTSEEMFFYKFVFSLVLFYLTLLICDYGKSWQSFDISGDRYRRALNNGPQFVPEDFTRVFNSGPDGYCLSNPRARYVQDLVSLLDFKFRVWVLKYVPPHPSLSLVWLLILILSPLFFFKLVYNLTLSREAAWIGLILFCLSTGSLSGITQRDDPAKPLVNFLAVFCFYLASKFNLSRQAGGRLNKKSFSIYLLLLAALLTAFFTDESALVLYPLILVLFPAFLGLKRFRLVVLALYLLLPVVFMTLLFSAVPALLNHYSPGEINFDNYRVMKYLDDPDTPWAEVLKCFGFRYVVSSGKNLISSQLLPWGREYLGVGYIAVGFYFFRLFRKMSRRKKQLLLRALVALVIFIVCQSFGMASVYWSEGFVILYPFYYGALLSVFLTLPLAIILSTAGRKSSAVANKIILICISVVLAYNFIQINEDCRQMQGCWEKTGTVSRSLVRQAWQKRHDRKALLKLKSRFPLRSEWNYIQEIEVIAEQHAAKQREQE